MPVVHIEFRRSLAQLTRQAATSFPGPAASNVLPCGSAPHDRCWESQSKLLSHAYGAQVFYATSRYGLFETFRDSLAKYRKTDFAQRFFTAATAGGCAALISCPVEVCLVRF